MQTITTVTKDFSYRGQHYSIVFDGKFYMTVNHKFIGDELTKNDLDMRYYESQGMSRAEAFAKVFNVPIEIAKMVYAA